MDSPTKEKLTMRLRVELEKRAYHHGIGQHCQIEYCDFCSYSRQWIVKHGHGDDCILRTTP